jgi:anti-sigma-K factor RskA
MSEHPDTRDLLGPYVMGNLDAHEEHEVEDHLQICASCRREALELRLAHERLTDLARSFEAPSDDLKERVVAGIPRREARRRISRWLVAAAAAVLCVLAVIGAVRTPDLFGGEALASANLAPTGRAPDAGGVVSVQGSGENVKMRLEAWGLPPCKSEQYYELWLVEGDERVSAGSFTVGQSGRVEVTLNAPTFAASYPQVGVTAEYDKDPRASETKILSGELQDL